MTLAEIDAAIAKVTNQQTWEVDDTRVDYAKLEQLQAMRRDIVVNTRGAAKTLFTVAGFTNPIS